MTQALERQQTSATLRAEYLDRALGAVGVTWEALAYAAIGVAALVTRFWDLGSRAMHHDESLHVLYSWYLYVGRGYQHDPMMHGPLQFHINALIYFLFGDSDYTGRVQYAAFGVALVLLPFFMRQFIGRWGALATSILLLISPSILYYSRFARNEIIMLFLNTVLALAVWRYLRYHKTRDLYLAAAMMGLGFACNETQYITVAIFGSFLTGYWLWELAPTRKIPSVSELRESPIFSMLILLGTLTLPMLAAATRIIHLAPTGTQAVTIGPWVTNQQIFGEFAIAGIFFLISAAVGMWWNQRVWPVYAALFWVIVVLFYSTFFTNPQGIGSGVWGALSYWIDQHDVMRGGQPMYYYLLLTPLYEYLPLLLSVAGVIFYAFRRDLFTPFTAFLLYWVIGAFVAYSWAGEKMPWLLTYMALPLVLFGGQFLGRVAERINWRSTASWRGIASGGLFILAALVLAAAFGAIIQASAAGAAWGYRPILLVFVAILLIGAGLQLGLALGKGGAAGIAGMAALVLLTLLTMRTAWAATYRHSDTAVEMLIYTQSTPDITRINKEIEQISLETTGGHDLKVSVDSTSGFTWPWAWYLRNYKNVDYPNYSSQAGPPLGDVVLVHANNVERMRPYLTDYTQGMRYRHRWWFPEDYKSPIEWVAAMGSPAAAQAGRPNSSYGLGDAIAATFSPSGLDTIWRYFFNRDLGKPLGSEDGYFFVKKGLASSTTAAAPPAAPAAPDAYQQAQINAMPNNVIGSRGVGPGQFVDPRGAAVDSQGNLYVVDTGNNRIEKFDNTGRFVAQAGGAGDGNGQFKEPWGIAVGPDDTIWVADTWNHRIQHFGNDLQFINKFGEFGEAGNQVSASPGKFYGPRSIAFMADGSLIVTDTGNKRIQRFKQDGTFVAAMGGQGTGPGQFQEPVGLAVGADGSVFVADTWNHRIQRLNQNLQPLGSLSLKGWESTGILNKPYLAVDANGNVLATDPENHRVLRFGPDGQINGVLGKYGADPGSMNLPIGIAVSPEGPVYVVDSGNNRVERFDQLP